jgi:hypothetical protein
VQVKIASSVRAMCAIVTVLASSILLQANATTSSATSEPKVNLCTVVNSVTSLRVSRGIPLNPTTFTFPRLVLVKRATSTKAVATALCALPAGPTGVVNCPADFGFDYRLSFTARGYNVADVQLDPTGCQWVKGIDPVRWVEQSPHFFRVLGAAMQLKHLTASTFRGTLSNS